MDTLRRILIRSYLNIKLDIQWLFTTEVPWRVRREFISSKYWSMILGDLSIKMFRGVFKYDNAMMPAIMAESYFELEKLRDYVHVESLRNVMSIGAGIGQFDVLLKQRNPDLHLYSYEPSPNAFPLLKQNSAHFKNWRVFNFGIAREDGVRTLFTIKGHSSDSSVFKELTNQDKVEYVERATIQVREMGPTAIQAWSVPTHYDLIRINSRGAEFTNIPGLRYITWDYLYVRIYEFEGVKASVDKAVVALMMAGFPDVEVVWVSDMKGSSSFYTALIRNRAGKNKTASPEPMSAKAV